MPKIMVEEQLYKENLETVKEDEEISVAIKKLKREQPPALIVEDSHGKYKGILTRRTLRRVRSDPSRHVKNVTSPVPSVKTTDDVAEAARLMIENQIPVLPVYAGERLDGFITQDKIIESSMETELGDKKISEVMTENPVTAKPDDTIARVLDLMRTYGISHTPVTVRDKLEGIVSIHDMFDIVLRERERQEGGFRGDDRGGHGERSGESSNLMHMKIRDIMSTPVVASRPDDTLRESTRKMQEHNISSLVVMDRDADLIVGIVTKRDLLQPIAQQVMEQQKIRVQFSVKPGVRMTDDEKDAVMREFDSFTRKYEDQAGFGNMFVYLRHYGPVSKGNQLIQCRLQLRTAHHQYYSSAEAWSAEEAYALALDRLERRVLEHKTTKLSEEHSRRHIEELLKSEEL